MAIYEFEGINLEGTTSGTIDASGKKHAKRKLMKRGIKPTSLRKRQALNQKTFWKTVILLNVLLAQNITLVDAVKIAKDQKNKKLSQAFSNIYHELQEGRALHEILLNIFPDTPNGLIGMIRIGSEKKGLSTALDAVIKQKTERDKLLSEMRKATAYPLFVIFFAIIALVVVFDSVLPEFVKITDTSNSTQLQLLIFGAAGKGYSTVVKLFWIAVFSIATLGLSVKVAKIKWFYFSVLEGIPIIRSYLFMRTGRELLHTLALAVNLKTELTTALQMSADAISNPIHKERFQTVPNELKEGNNLSDTLRKLKFINEIDYATLRLAEQSHSLVETIGNIDEKIQLERVNRVAIISQIIGPVAMLILGAVIFVVAYVIITPMIALQTTIG